MKTILFLSSLLCAQAFAATSIHCDLRAQSEGPIKPVNIGSVDLPLKGLIIKENHFDYENKDDPDGTKLKAKVSFTVSWEKKEKTLGLWFVYTVDPGYQIVPMASRVETRMTLAANKGSETSIELMPAWGTAYAHCEVK